MNPANDIQAPEAVIDDCTPVVPATPFQNIALMFSGGGFRAASFSLGVLSYLHRIRYKGKPLRENVKFITSTSGGSITNGYYTSSLYTNKPFDFTSFYNSLRSKMDGEDLLHQVFGLLKDGRQWTETGRLKNPDGSVTEVKKPKNLINAFAKSYDASLFHKTTLGTIADNFKDSQGAKPHLEESCFNTT